MDKIKYRIILDAHKGGVQKVIRGFFTGDVASRTIAVNINASGLPCNLGVGTAAIMYVTKSNGVTNYGACEVIDNTVYYDVNQSDIDSPGIVEMQLKILNGESVLYAPLFALDVQESKVSDTEAETTPTFSALEAALAKAQFVYDTRIVSIEITPEYVFVVKYADDSEYTNDCLSDVFARADEAIQGVNDALGDFEESRTELQGYVDSALESRNVAESMAQSASGSADASQSFAEDASAFATRAEQAAERAETVADLTIDTELSADSTNPIANKAVAEEFKNVNKLSHTFRGQISVSDFNEVVEGGIYYCSVQNGAANAPQGNYTYNGFLEVKTAGNKVYHTFISSYDFSIITRMRKNDTEWSEWETIATLSDLANYLPKTGGKLTGALTVEDLNGVILALIASNADNVYSQYIGKSGLLGLLGFIGKDNPVMVGSDGSTVQKLLHVGNIANYAIARNGPGSQTVAAPSTRPISINNTHESSSYVAIGYYLRSTKIGEIGVDNTNNPVFVNADGVGTKIHHDGNSAKVHIGTTAPNDTTGNVLFINTNA